jgi:hypothetical protein
LNSPNRGFPAGNPIANALVIVVGALAIAASVVLGFFAFLVVLSLLTVGAVILGIRTWWFRRSPTRSAGQADGAPGTADESSHTSGNVIEGEFRVIEGGKSDSHSDRQ